MPSLKCSVTLYSFIWKEAFALHLWDRASGKFVAETSTKSRTEPVDVLTIHLYANLSRAKGNGNGQRQPATETVQTGRKAATGVKFSYDKVPLEFN